MSSLHRRLRGGHKSVRQRGVRPLRAFLAPRRRGRRRGAGRTSIEHAVSGTAAGIRLRWCRREDGRAVRGARPPNAAAAISAGQGRQAFLVAGAMRRRVTRGGAGHDAEDRNPGRVSRRGAVTGRRDANPARPQSIVAPMARVPSRMRVGCNAGAVAPPRGSPQGSLRPGRPRALRGAGGVPGLGVSSRATRGEERDVVPVDGALAPGRRLGRASTRQARLARRAARRRLGTGSGRRRIPDALQPKSTKPSTGASLPAGGSVGWRLLTRRSSL